MQHTYLPAVYKLLFITALISTSFLSDSITQTNRQPSNIVKATPAISTGYSMLKLLLENEQHLSTIRRAKMLVNLADISHHSSKLIDNISTTSTQALDKLAIFTSLKPVIVFEVFSDKQIAMATFSTLRNTTAKTFLFDGDYFEKDLLLSQLKILRVISFLAKQLQGKETNHKRKRWLDKLAMDFETYYQEIYTRIRLQP